MSAPILIVEDDAGIREMLVDCLSDAGYATVTADNGHGALDLLRANGLRPALILLDLAMPLMSGQEFLKLWRQDGRNEPVLVLTADMREREHAQVLGVNRVLTKPLDIMMLLATVDELVRGNGTTA